MSALNPNAAARLPSLWSPNTPHTATAASPPAASAKAAAAQGDKRSEFSRLLVRSQNAADVTHRFASAADKTPSQHRPVSPAPTPRAEPARSSPPDRPSTAATEAGTDVADVTDGAEASTAASASPAQPAQPAQRPAAARSKAITVPHAGPVEAAPADPIAADPIDLKDPAAVAAARLAPAVVDPASLAVWGALPLPPVTPPVSAAAGEIAGSGEAVARAGGSMAPQERPIDAKTTAPPAAESLRANEATDTLLASDPASATRWTTNTSALPIDAGLAAAKAPTPLPDAALIGLVMPSGGVRTESQRERRDGADLTPASAWAIGAPGGSPLARGVEAVAPPASASVATPLTDSGFHQALGMQVSLLAREGIHQAELRLNPADLGPVSVQITMNGDQARVDFGADLAQTRQVIEAGWAELAASLQEAGFTLSGGGVSEHARDRNAPEAGPSRGADGSAVTDEMPVASVVMARPRAGAALDLYA